MKLREELREILEMDTCAGASPLRQSCSISSMLHGAWMWTTPKQRATVGRQGLATELANRREGATLHTSDVADTGATGLSGMLAESNHYGLFARTCNREMI